MSFPTAARVFEAQIREETGFMGWYITLAKGLDAKSVSFMKLGGLLWGGALGGGLNVLYVLCVSGIELCPPAHRFMITMVASFIEMAGQFLMPGLAALCRDWQVLQAVIICPFLLMLLYWV